MALTFGKGNRSVAFNPTSAFPLDARSYFESYDLALAAAQTAEAAGSTNTQYYFGQTVVVVENNLAHFYIIQPDGSLGEVGGKVEFSTQAFVTDDDGKINLLGFADAVAGAQLTKGLDGSLKWVKPDTTTVDGLSTAVETLRDDLDNLAAKTYTKSETEAKIAEAVANSAHLKRKIVASLEEAATFVNQNSNSVEYIFMVPAAKALDGDKYDEYIAIEVPDGEGTIRVLEKVGSWEVDLSDYAKTEDVETALNGKVDAEEGARLITDDEVAKLERLLSIEEVDGTLQFTGTSLGVKQISATQVIDLASWITENAGKTKGLTENNFSNELNEKLIAIENGAEKNYIRSVSDEFTVSDAGQLSIKTIAAAQVTGLSQLLQEKANADVVATLRSDVDTIALHLTWGELE